MAVSGAAKTIYIGGQDAVDEKGEIVGKGDLKAQTEQVLKNLRTALTAAGATMEHLVKCTIYVVPNQPMHLGFQAYQAFVGKEVQPPTISVLVVAGLANPDFLVEIDAIAVVPE